ncbi:hypothetical protein B0H16DRAFT_1486628 [Mycena metata]|uniref:Uncharacterized protein n=1 Tax=Mycena metata TaxID=1033252 RepID=A0AAD7DHZ6_9AGAR|nr:hypothetical protein B0H16DRAFT_1486628 [Mycena metata]
MLWSRHLQKSAVHQLLGHILTYSSRREAGTFLFAAAICAESDDQQDTEPKDSEPYLDTSDLNATVATTDTEAAGPTPPPPPKNKKRNWRPYATPIVIADLEAHHCRKGIREAVVISAGHVASPAAYLKHAVGAMSLPTTLDPDTLSSGGCIESGRPLVDANGRIFAVLADRPNAPAYAPAIARAFDRLAMSTTTS